MTHEEVEQLVERVKSSGSAVIEAMTEEELAELEAHLQTCDEERCMKVREDEAQTRGGFGAYLRGEHSYGGTSHRDLGVHFPRVWGEVGFVNSVVSGK